MEADQHLTRLTTTAGSRLTPRAFATLHAEGPHPTGPPMARPDISGLGIQGSRTVCNVKAVERVRVGEGGGEITPAVRDMYGYPEYLLANPKLAITMCPDASRCCSLV